MADAVVTDSAKTVVFDDRNGHRNYGPSWSAEPTFGQTAIAKHVGDIGAHLLNALHTQLGHITRGQGDVRSDVRDVGHNVSRDVINGQRDILSGICDTRDAVRQDGSATRERIQSEGRGLSEGQGTIRREIAVESGNIRKDICDTREAVRLEGCNTREVVKDRTDALARDMLREFAQTRLEDCKNFSDLRLQASENTARLSRELAECCCELKELTRAENSATRDILRQNELDALRQENTLLKIGNIKIG